MVGQSQPSYRLAFWKSCENSNSACFPASVPTPFSAPTCSFKEAADYHADYSDPSKVPECYSDLPEVFNKSKVTSLSPYYQSDCAINLLPGTSLPKGKLYSPSGPEMWAMRNYVDSSLKAGIILPSSSPACTRFFLCGTKDKTLHPCIHSWALITSP